MCKIREVRSFVDRIYDFAMTEEDMLLSKRLSESLEILCDVVHAWEEKEEGKSVMDGWSHHCRRCGRCCMVSTDRLGGASVNDIATWIVARRFDILAWVGPLMTPDSRVIAFDIWVDPETNEDAMTCPWLGKTKNGRFYGCSIHKVKPEACRKFPLNRDHAEKFDCPVVSREKVSRPAKKVVINVSRAPDVDRF